MLPFLYSDLEWRCAIITLVTTGKFFMMDLAEELDSINQLQALITAYPKMKLKEFTFSSEKVFPRPFPYSLNTLINQRFSLSSKVRSRMEISNFLSVGKFSASKWDSSSDVVSMSGVALELGKKVLQTKYKYTICRSSRHIEDQLKILERENNIWGYPGELPDKKLIDRELIDYELADTIIVPSEICKDSFRGKGIDIEKVKVVHFPFIQKRLENANIEKKSKFIITFVGSVTLRKGISYLLEAIRMSKDLQLQVNIIGSYDKKFLEHLNKMRLVDERVIFHGPLPRNKIASFLSITDIFVMPSVEEGWPIAWLEAMSMGCVPIVSDAICKFSEAPIRDERMFFQSGDSSDLARKILFFYNNPKVLQIAKLEVKSAITNSETWHDFAVKILEITKSSNAKR
jgi:glycosyltransferase involved in cell wall biosynthesis